MTVQKAKLKEMKSGGTSHLNCTQKKEPNPTPSVLEQLFEIILFCPSLLLGSTS